MIMAFIIIYNPTIIYYYGIREAIPDVTNLPPTFWVCPNDAQIRTAFGQIRSD